MYKKFTQSFLVILIGLLIPTSLYAKCGSSDPISLVQKAVMSFGTTAAGTSGGSIKTNGNVTGDVVYLEGTLTKGKVQVIGSCNSTVYVSFVDGTVTSGTNSMVVQIASAPKTIVLNRRGKKTIQIAAFLLLGPMQASGSYSGSYTVVANY
ncbi:MAG: DUF4402 domain-containing protein [Proteobacteria bacterium]|nr:DUF4402 domain-containing protein [Pseudomonadota bacterium]